MADVQLHGYPGNLFAQQVTIPNGAAVSEVLCTQGKALIGIRMPTSWTAAAIGYKVGISGNPSFFVSAKDSGGNFITTIAAGASYIAFPESDQIFAPYLQITSVTAATETPVNQGADRILTLLFRNYLD